jgi:hypothetical protein
MFYKTGVDITKDKSMFNFLKNHFEYPTLNSWNGLHSIANNVKIHNLNLSGNCWTALQLLENGEYDNIRWMIVDWEREHDGYEVYFNGRSNGYLILTEEHNNYHILPNDILDCDTYEDYKEYCRDNYGSVKANRDDLVYYTKLVQDFDKLCDELRDYCDQLSKLRFEVVEMEKSVYRFNEDYADDLELLGFETLTCDSEGRVDVSEIQTLQCLYEAFFKIADRSDSGYTISKEDGGFIRYMER